MKFSNSIPFLIIFLSALLLQSCKDEPTGPENQPDPKILVTYPPDSSFVRDDITIKVNIYNLNTVKFVNFFIDGNFVVRDSSSPYEYFWNVYYYEDNTHTILAEATDKNDNLWPSDLMTVFLDKLSQEAVSLVQPQNAWIFKNDNKVEFIWNKFEGAQSYVLEIADDPLFVYNLNSRSVTDTSVVVEGFNEGNYYWHVKAVDQNNQSGKFSGSRTFEVTHPDAPVLLLPENQSSMKTGSTPVLVWSGSDFRYLYEYQVSTSKDFSDIIITSELYDTLTAPENLTMNAYYWRVRCQNTAGFWSDWSDSFTFGLGVFSKIYGGEGLEYGSRVIETPDHGFLLLGKTTSYGNGVYDVYLVKTDELGNVIRTKTYGSYDDDRGSDMKLTSDGGMIITGSTVVASNPYSDYNVYLIKTDA